jgi:hypothetical protein
MTGNEAKAGLPVGRICQLDQDGEADHSVGGFSPCVHVTSDEASVSLTFSEGIKCRR